jgi:hypothetical protein
LPSNKLLVLSGSTKLRFNSVVNHKAYADEWGYGYHFDLSPIRELASPFFTKIEILLGQLKPNGPEWVFWIDDDAYFTDFSKPLHSFLSECESSTDLVFCESPKNQSGEWTWMSSGQFFLRNSERSRRLLKAVLETPISSVRECGTQASSVFSPAQIRMSWYSCSTSGLISRVRILGWTTLNSTLAPSTTNANWMSISWSTLSEGRTRKDSEEIW